MKFIFITPGSGDNFYCENCLRDTALAGALYRSAHDVLVVPLYLPLNLEDGGIAVSELFFGGINVYLQQKSAIFRKLPRWLGRLLDRPGLLNWLAKKSDMTDAGDLTEMTLSMLRGEEGRQVKELERLVDWLVGEERPDVIILSNALLLGVVRQLKERLEVPIVCLLQDEDEFIDALPEGDARRVWTLMAERGEDVDLFIASSGYFGGFIGERMGIAEEKMRVVHTGVAVDDYHAGAVRPAVRTIGFLSRLCGEKGLDILVDAFIALKGRENFGDVRLRVAGGQTVADKEFIGGVRGKLEDAGYLGDVDFVEDFRKESRLDFLRSLTVLAVPEKRPPACGLHALEALACGVPAILPDHGVFSEMAAMIGKGIVLHEPGNGDQLLQSLQLALTYPENSWNLGQQGRMMVREKFDIQGKAGELIEVCGGL